MTTKTLDIIVQKEVSVIVKQAEALIVSDSESLKEATTMLSKANQIVDKVTEEKEKVTKPLNEALKAERGRWKPIEAMYEEAIGLIRSKMTKYQTDLITEQRIAEKKITDALASGKIKKVETAIRKLEAVPEVNKEVATDAGLVQFVETKKFEVMDISLVPTEYLVPNEAMIRQAMKDGKELKGVRYYTEMVPRNYR